VERFARNFWEVVLAKVPSLRARFGGDSRVSRIEYTDRYLRNPITVRLLLEAVRYLVTDFAAKQAKPPDVTVATIPLERGRQRRPMTFRDDWEDDAARKAVIEQGFRSVGVSATVAQSERARLPHHRGMTVHWEDGSAWRLRLDEGFSFLSDGRNSERFPFQSAPPEQVRRLLEARLFIDRNFSLKTQFYVEHVS
jgi:hypothetical protein